MHTALGVTACFCRSPGTAAAACSSGSRDTRSAALTVILDRDAGGRGHSSRAITSDTYTTVLPEIARAAAEAAAALIPAAP